MSFDDVAVDRHTRYAVDLFLHGLLPRGDFAAHAPGDGAGAATADATALENENRRLRKLLVESMLELAALKEGRAKA
jgi:hypothetical protein